MGTCPKCGAERAEGIAVCPACGADAEPIDAQIPDAITTADYDPEDERELFERRYGIDIGDRTISEFLTYLDRQDYSTTPWFWLLVVAEIGGILLFAASLFSELTLGTNGRLLFVSASILVALGVFIDTRAVGQFERWAKIRWTYVLFAAIPVIGHITGAFYLILRHLMCEQTAEYRRRLLDAGFDLDRASRSD